MEKSCENCIYNDGVNYCVYPKYCMKYEPKENIQIITYEMAEAMIIDKIKTSTPFELAQLFTLVTKLPVKDVDYICGKLQVIV